MLTEPIRALILDEQARQNGCFIEGVDLDQYLAKLGRQSEIVSLTDGDRCRGFIAFYCNNTTTRRAYITLMAVSPTDRRTGLGRSLVSSVLSIAKGRAFRWCGLEIATGNNASLALFQSMGFDVVERRASSNLLEIAL